MATAKTFFDRFSRQYEEQSRYKHIFYKWIIRTIFRNIDKEKCRILDLGTGNGELGIRLAMRFPKSEVIGLDISAGMINQAKKKVKKIGVRNIRFMVSPMEKAKIQKIDFAVSSVAFHHVKDKRKVLFKMHEILPDGGKVLIGDWFKPGKDYRKQVEKLRKRNPERTARFDKSWKQFLNAMTQEYGEKHPKEYPLSPTRLKDIMAEVGFSRSKIVKSPLPTFAVVIGIK